MKDNHEILKFKRILWSTNCLRTEPAFHNQTSPINAIKFIHTSYIPNVQFESIVHERFDIETLSWHDM